MKKERKIETPDGYEIEKVKLIDGVAVVTFREKDRKLPKSWEEFCEMFDIKWGESRILTDSTIQHSTCRVGRCGVFDKNVLPDRATAEAVLALCQLVQLRDCYNGDWVPDWTDFEQKKYIISPLLGNITHYETNYTAGVLLYFKSEELRDEFLRNFRDLIEKLKPLYGIKKGGEQ